MSRGPLVVIGDALLDIDVRGTVSRTTPDGQAPVVDCADRHERPGGAALAALLAAAPADREIVLITGVGDDEAGERVVAMLDGAVRLIRLPLTGGTPEKARVMTPARTLLRLDTGQGRVAPGTALPADARRALAGAAAILVADYGRGISVHPEVTAALTEVGGLIPVIWDPHPRGGRPVPAARLVTPNEAEARALCAQGFPAADQGIGDVTVAGHRARYLARTWSASGVAVTLGPRGAVLAAGDRPPVVIPAPPVTAPDTCGAGDSFAAAAARALADGLPLTDVVAFAVRTATRFVAAGAASAIRAQEGEGACQAAVPSARSW